MMLTRSAAPLNLTHVRPLDHATSMQIAANENEAMGRLLAALDEREWNLSTDCERWSVRDIVAHLTGWGECMTSAREAARQVGGSVRRRAELGGIVHAQNEVQVEHRRDLSTAELLRRYETASERFLRLRRRFGAPARLVPFYMPIFGMQTLSSIADAIFTRDTFMHRIDIAVATGRELTVGLHQEMLITDIVRDWAKRTKVPVVVELSGPGGGVFTHHEPRVVIKASAIDFCRFNAGRVPPEDLDAIGDESDVALCLSARAPF